MLLRMIAMGTLLGLSAMGVVCAAPQAGTGMPNADRLRALDLAPFESAIGRFSTDRMAAIDALLAKATIVDIQAAMKAGKLTSIELTTYFLSRIKQYDSRLRTYLELNPRALDEAQASDARRKAGTLLGPLDALL